MIERYIREPLETPAGAMEVVEFTKPERTKAESGTRKDNRKRSLQRIEIRSQGRS